MNWLTKQNVLIGVGVIALIFVIIIAWMFGDMIRDTVRGWQKASSAEEVIAAKEEAANAKAIASEAIKDLADTKQRLAQQIEVTKQAEQRLFAANKISEAAKTDYENEKNRILNNEYVSTNPNLNTDELCQRAKSLGISCE